MSGSRWQGMKTRHGDGTEALSEEMESNGSATPKSRRHPLTLPADKCGHSPTLSGFGPNGGFGVWWLCPPIPALAGTDYLQCQGSEGKSFEAPVNHPRESLSLAVFFFFEPVFFWGERFAVPVCLFFRRGLGCVLIQLPFEKTPKNIKTRTAAG